MMVARFQRHVCRCAASRFAARVRVAERLDFRVCGTCDAMPTFADRPTVANQHRTDGRVRCDIATCARCKFNRARKIDPVGGVYET